MIFTDQVTQNKIEINRNTFFVNLYTTLTGKHLGSRTASHGTAKPRPRLTGLLICLL